MAPTPEWLEQLPGPSQLEDDTPEQPTRTLDEADRLLAEGPGGRKALEISAQAYQRWRTSTAG